MIRDAVNEIRLHPGRFIATLIAIAISVGYIATISLVVNTEQRSIANSLNLPLTQADIVVQRDSLIASDSESPSKAKLAQVSGVAEVETTLMMSVVLTHGDASTVANLFTTPSEGFRWASLEEGRWPEKPGEIALATDALKQLGLKVGDTGNFGAGKGKQRVVGSTKDARSLHAVTAYGVFDGSESSAGRSSFLVKTAPDADTDAVVAALREAVSGTDWKVTDTDTALREAVSGLTGGVDVFKRMLLIFAGIAVIVGMIVIANTFTILVTQRRRQIGLLRAVGASTGQVRGRLVLEALMLGIIGSLAGIGLGLLVALAAGTYTGSLYWGLWIRPEELLGAMVVGVLATLISVLGPLLVASRVKPLEALQVVPAAAKAKRIGVVRIVVCAVFAVLGAGLTIPGIGGGNLAIVYALLAGLCITVAVLGAAPLYVPALLRGLGKVFGFTGATLRLAAENSARNPQRAGATAVALMLAVGLIVTLQVGVATARTSGRAAIDERYPIDVTVSSSKPLTNAVMQRLRDINGVATVAPVSVKQVDQRFSSLEIHNINPARAAMGLPRNDDIPDGVLLVPQDRVFSGSRSSRVEVPTKSGGTVTLRVVRSDLVDDFAVSEATFNSLQGQDKQTTAWIKLTDRTSFTALNQIQRATQEIPGINLQGGAFYAGILDQVLNVIIVVLTALLGVAVLIALVGIGNTLGLSVIERQRESALLRALGMQRAGLRSLLLVEALLLALVGTVVGLVAGGFFGWLGVSSVFSMMPAESRPDLHFSVDVGYTGMLIGVCVLAACLASVLPGRRAANATPTEALAVD